MKFFFLIIVFLFSLNSFAIAPGAAGTLSIIPGLGQAATGNYTEGLAWFTIIGGLAVNKSTRSKQIAFDLWQYNIYDANRDAANKPSTFLGEYFANYNPLNAFDAIGTPFLLLGSTNVKGRNITAESIVEMSFVGLGEEGLFRGLMFPGLTSMFNSKWTGAILSSAIFAVVHLDGGSKIPFRFFSGMLFCWQADRNNYNLSNNIFTHSWFDVMVTSGSTSKIDGFKYQYKIDF